MQTKITYFLIFIITLSSDFCYGQSDSVLFRDSKTFYYSATDFSQVDSLQLWFYVFMDKSPGYEDLQKPVGQLIIQRETVTRNWAPNFVFQIFEIKDSVYCFEKSKRVRQLSGCTPPNVAGDIIIIGKYIFLETHHCLICQSEDDKRDYCRPVVNKVFSHVDIKKTNSLDEIISQIPIKGQSMKIPL